MSTTHDPSDRLDDEMLAALGEGRLTPDEERRVLVLVEASGEDRAALRDLFPDRFAALFADNIIELPKAVRAERRTPEPAAAVPPPPLVAVSPPEPPVMRAPLLEAMPPARPAWKLLAFGLAASSAIFVALLLPATAPRHAGASYEPSRVRGGELPSEPVPSGEPSAAPSAPTPASSAGLTRRGGAAPGAPILVDLGVLSRWDALRGRKPWGAIVVTEGQQPRVFATSTRPGHCESTDTTLACLNLGRPEAVAVVVSTGAADLALDDLVNGHETWADFEAALRARAADEPWSVHFPLARPPESR